MGAGKTLLVLHRIRALLTHPGRADINPVPMRLSRVIRSGTT
ncbi:hypothetical protein ACFTXJ_13335 [Streptomyces zhihengii]